MHNNNNPMSHSLTNNSSDTEVVGPSSPGSNNEAVIDERMRKLSNSSSSESNSFNKETPDSPDPYLVTFDGKDDQEDMRNLSHLHKWVVAIIIALVSVCVTCISSSWSLAADNIMAHFNISHEVCTLGITCYIFGLGTGGMFLSPISEFHGRKITYVLGLFLTICFEVLTAFSPNIGGMLFGRFMSGFFGSSFMAVASGTFSDIFSKEEITYPLVLYTMSPFVGPGLGPLISGFINSNLNFRWTFIVPLIWSVVMLILLIIFIPETYQPVLLVRKAKRIRKETGDDKYYAALERVNSSLYTSIVISSKRPFALLFGDKMTGVLCFYTGFSLAIVYMFFVAFPYIFKTVYGFGLAAQGMSFLGLIIGMGLSSATTPGLINKQYLKLVEANGGVSKPEFRFLPLMYGVFVTPTGLFILAWTCYPNVHWIGPIIGSGIYGAGVTLVFNGIFGYTVDAYRLYTASAMATNSFTRSIMSGVFPLFALQMYEGLGVHWATTLLACFACVLIPIPFLFYKYGESLRSKSKYTWSD
ncbi:probable drug/proton antiporter Yhk8p [[Candida] railenensis]|uniref:Probable drug/proton antiporter Yhk8p n=1 Tax=[Candida] railenensis TaxID=45579 RepID=A0A9P0VXS7_9ASCO|nr:probable drug/proton antiporter Yhk8p [[Candida] railenensis]